MFVKDKNVLYWFGYSISNKEHVISFKEALERINEGEVSEEVVYNARIYLQSLVKTKFKYPNHCSVLSVPKELDKGTYIEASNLRYKMRCYWN